MWSLAAWAKGAPVASMSPRPECVAPRLALRLAEELAAQGQACEIVVGMGGSMLPLYPDRTVLLIERQPLSELRAGMTVVFIGDSGRPVAHVLLEKTARGWVAQGLANPERDRTLVRAPNYLGTVVRAFTPTWDAVPPAPLPAQPSRALPLLVTLNSSSAALAQ